MRIRPRNWIARVPTDRTARTSSVDKRTDPCQPSNVPDWKLFREEAKRLAGDGPEEWGWLQVLDNRLMADEDAPEPPVTPWWRETLRAFWASGRAFFANAKGQRSTASTTITRCLVLETAMREREVVLGQMAMSPIISANTAEANQRCGPLEIVLSKGLRLSKVAERAKLEASNYFGSTNEAQGRSVFDLLDTGGHKIRLAVAPATREAASGFTGAGALVDELDLWPSTGANAAADVLTLLHGRLHSQKGARIYHVSTPMGPSGPLSTMIRNAEKSGAEELFVSRLGELGARRDGEAREAFRKHLQQRARHADDPATRASCARWEADPRLSRDPDPRSFLIPTWAARAGDPFLEIKECWRLVGVQLRDGDEGGDPLDVLMARYGAEPAGSDGRRLFSPSVLSQARGVSPVWS